MTSSFEKMSYSELVNLHAELEDFVEKNVATMPNNSSARVAPFEKCNTRGTHMTCVVDGCNLLDFFELDRELEALYGKGAKFVPERAANGSGFYVRLQVPIQFLKSKRPRSSSSGRGASFQTPFLLFLLDVALCGALYLKVTTL